MPCFRTLTAWKGPGGAITFNQKHGYYDLPLQINCGMCIGCRAEKQRSWAIRAMHESAMHPKNCFLTLTYDAKHLPKDHELVPAHWQNFAKRVRNRVGPFRYLHCGEYGEINSRPHYHALVFGQDFHEDSVPFHQPGSENLYISETVAKLWPYGFHTLGPVTPETARYVASYTLKKAMGKTKGNPLERLDPTTGEVWTINQDQYSTCSRRPGLGTSWFHKYWRDVYPDNFVLFDGKKCKPPLFYDRLLEKYQPSMYETMREQRRKHIRDNAWNHTADRLDVREAVTRAKFNLKEKPLD